MAETETTDKPVTNCDELAEAVEECKRNPNPNRERYLINQSVELGCTEHIPDEWELK